MLLLAVLVTIGPSAFNKFGWFGWLVNHIIVLYCIVLYWICLEHRALYSILLGIFYAAQNSV